MTAPLSARPAPEPVLAQGRLERVFVDELVACTKRAEFEQARSQPDWNSYPLLLGGLVDRVFKRELTAVLRDQGFTTDLGALIRRFIAGDRRLNALDDATKADLLKQTASMIRAWTGRFDWLEAVLLDQPDRDYFIRRPQRFAVRVKPDAVVGLDDAIVCVEATTSRNPDYISQARYALNWWALSRERMRRPEWNRYSRVVTHVELLALNESFTVEFTPEQAEAWRGPIAEVAEDLLAGRYVPNPGPHCTTCYFQSACWFGSQVGPGDDF
jgi:hypothetical protein